MLQVRQLEKALEHRRIYVEHLDVAKGDIVAIVGATDAGKTLLLQLIAGLSMPSGGSIKLDGQDVSGSAEVRRRIGILFAEDMLYERLTVRQNLEFYSQLFHVAGSRIAEVLKQIGLADQHKVPVEKLTPASKRRLAFARLLLVRSDVYVLDQPALRTDRDTQGLFARLITQLAQEGAAILVAEEDLAWAGTFCSHVLEMVDGRGITSYVINNSKDAVVPERHVPYKVPARKDDRIMLFDPGDILYAMSRDGKTFLRTVQEEATTSLTLQELENRMVGRGFFKAHRAYLVNLQHIKAVIQYTRNSYTLQLDDPQETMIPLSKQCEKELQELLGY